MPDPKPKMPCPRCRNRKHPVRYFSALGNERYGYSIGANFTACEKKSCLLALESLAAGKQVRILPLEYSSAEKFKSKIDQRIIKELIEAVCK